MSQAACNKQLIEQYFAVLSGQVTDRSLADFFAADVVWHAPPYHPLVTPNPRVGHAAVMDLLSSGVGTYQPGSIQVTLHRLLAEATLVGAQFSLHAMLMDGQDYHNEYFLLFAVNQGKIGAVWEYLDTFQQFQYGMFKSS